MKWIWLALIAVGGLEMFSCLWLATKQLASNEAAMERLVGTFLLGCLLYWAMIGVLL